MIKNEVGINSPMITIGLPVYNGERFIQKRLDSLLKQSFENFELIISDNASEDNTEQICKRCMEIDNRIIYFRQEQNIGGVLNYKFLLNKAKGKYFIWAAVDDLLLPTFLEKNLKILESQNNVVCSTSKIKSYGEKTDYIENISTNSIIKRLEKKIRIHFWLIQNIPTSGSFEKKVRIYLKTRGTEQVISGLYRTEQLKKFIVKDDFHAAFDLSTIINALKFGDIFVLDEVLALRYDGGESSGGLINFAKQTKISISKAIFSNIPFTCWFIKSHGKKIFLKNLDCFIKINFYPFFYYFVDLGRIILKKQHDFNNKIKNE